jgi:hypothetical protein
VLQQYEYPNQSKHYLVAIAPLSLDRADAFYREQLPKAGYTLTPGDAEPGEIDLVVAGLGLNANLRLATPPGCADATLIEMVLRTTE